MTNDEMCAVRMTTRATTERYKINGNWDTALWALEMTVERVRGLGKKEE